MTAPTFVAQYPGSCAAQCGEPVQPGDPCVFVTTDDIDAPASYAHAQCQAEACAMDQQSTSASQKWGQTCPHCFLAMPITGRCDCRD